MSNYHTYECDRCGRKERVAEFPKFWAAVRINDTNRSSSPITDADLCNRCIKEVYEAISRIPEVLPAPQSTVAVSRDANPGRSL